MKRQTNVKKNQVAEIDCYGGEIFYSLFVTAVTRSGIKGRILYSDTAYGNAVVHDFLEKGKPVKLNWNEISAIKILNDSLAAEEIQKAVKERNRLAKTFIRKSGSVMQEIKVGIENNGIEVEFTGTLPDFDKDGVPVVTKAFCYMTSDNLEDARNTLNERFRFCSGSGVFLPETKIKYISKIPEARYIAESYLKAGFMFLEGTSLDVMNIVSAFIEAAQEQIGQTKAA